MNESTKLILGDCREVLKEIPDNSVDLIFTSPPYADRRKNTYGGGFILMNMWNGSSRSVKNSYESSNLMGRSCSTSRKKRKMVNATRMLLS